jgi:hypothetical protein
MATFAELKVALCHTTNALRAAMKQPVILPFVQKIQRTLLAEESLAELGIQMPSQSIVVMMWEFVFWPWAVQKRSLKERESILMIRVMECVVIRAMLLHL